MWICIILVILYPLPRIEKIAHILYVVFTKIACRGNNECQVSISNPLIYVTCYITNNYEILFLSTTQFLLQPCIIQFNIVVAVESQEHSLRIIAFLSKRKGQTTKAKELFTWFFFESICWKIIQLQSSFDRKIKKKLLKERKFYYVRLRTASFVSKSFQTIFSS